MICITRLRVAVISVQNKGRIKLSTQRKITAYSEIVMAGVKPEDFLLPLALAQVRRGDGCSALLPMTRWKFHP